MNYGVGLRTTKVVRCLSARELCTYTPDDYKKMADRRRILDGTMDSFDEYHTFVDENEAREYFEFRKKDLKSLLVLFDFGFGGNVLVNEVILTVKDNTGDEFFVERYTGYILPTEEQISECLKEIAGRNYQIDATLSAEESERDLTSVLWSFVKRDMSYMKEQMDRKTLDSLIMTVSKEIINREGGMPDAT